MMCFRWISAFCYERETTASNAVLGVRAVERLRHAKEMLDKRISLLERRRADHDRRIVELHLERTRSDIPLLTDRKKAVLKNEIRRRKMCELSTQKFDRLVGMLEEQINLIQDNESVAMAFDAIKTGNSASRQQNKLIEHLDIDKLMDDFLESDATAKNIAAAMETTEAMSQTMSDEQALEELERLINCEQIQQQFVSDADTETKLLLQGLPGIPKLDPADGLLNRQEKKKESMVGYDVIEMEEIFVD